MATALTVPSSRRGLPHPYVLWVGAATVSNVGVAALYFALGWAASAHGGSAAGLVITALVGTRTLLLLVGGAIADRVGPRAVMIAGDTALLVATAALAVAAAILGTPVWLLLAAAVIEGAVTAFYLPAEGSIPRHLVAATRWPGPSRCGDPAGRWPTWSAAPSAGSSSPRQVSPSPLPSTRSPTRRC